MSNHINSILSVIPQSQLAQKKDSTGSSSFFEALARAWGQVLDKQADTIQAASDAITAGDDSPSALTELTTQSLKMSFITNSSHTSITKVGEALDTMARKQ